ncbi:MAG: hypothetical protein KF841_03255 [Phycisphaerae bacterium]|nr:hypothetical protein [Phycisphaerae bacterium]
MAESGGGNRVLTVLADGCRANAERQERLPSRICRRNVMMVITGTQ